MIKVMNPVEHNVLLGTTWHNGKRNGHFSSIENLVHSLSSTITTMDGKARSVAMNIHYFNQDVDAMFRLICEDIHTRLLNPTKMDHARDQLHPTGKLIPIQMIRSLITSDPNYLASNGLFQPAEAWAQRLHLNQLEQRLIDYLDARGWEIGIC